MLTTISAPAGAAPQKYASLTFNHEGYKKHILGGCSDLKTGEKINWPHFFIGNQYYDILWDTFDGNKVLMLPR